MLRLTWVNIAYGLVHELIYEKLISLIYLYVITFFIINFNLKVNHHLQIGIPIITIYVVIYEPHLTKHLI